MKNSIASTKLIPVISQTGEAGESSDSLFEHFGAIYIFCREKLFRDDTSRMIRALWPKGSPEPGARAIELGCGPGFYSCRLAQEFPEISVVGVDSSARQLEWAEAKARANGINNCRFENDNVLDLSHADETFDRLVASRLFTVLQERQRAVAEMYRVLKPGGICFIAEPRHELWASIPLFTMWLLAGVTRFGNGYREPRKAIVLSTSEFERLLGTQPWRVKTWQAGRYHYAACEKY